MYYHNKLSEHLRIRLLSIFLCFQFFSFGQDFTLTTQAEVDAFDPALTHILGSLTIKDNDIVNLDNLLGLKRIDGVLNIYNNDLLADINGLSNIHFVGGTVYIERNNLLPNLGLDLSLDSIGGSLYIKQNNSLLNIDGLNNLIKINS